MPDELVVLYNRNRFRPFEATMYHSIVCVARGVCGCVEAEVAGVGGAPQTIRREGSFRIEPKGYSRALPREVLEIPQVQVALNSSQLKLVGQLAEVQRISPEGV